jgi:hypothetical protein
MRGQQRYATTCPLFASRRSRRVGWCVIAVFLAACRPAALTPSPAQTPSRRPFARPSTTHRHSGTPPKPSRPNSGQSTVQQQSAATAPYETDLRTILYELLTCADDLHRPSCLQMVRRWPQRDCSCRDMFRDQNVTSLEHGRRLLAVQSPSSDGRSYRT